MHAINSHKLDHNHFQTHKILTATISEHSLTMWDSIAHWSWWIQPTRTRQPKSWEELTYMTLSQLLQNWCPAICNYSIWRTFILCIKFDMIYLHDNDAYEFIAIILK